MKLPPERKADLAFMFDLAMAIFAVVIFYGLLDVVIWIAQR